MDRRMKLRDLLAYLEDREAIQVGVADEDYCDSCTEIYAGSSLLTACHDWDITAMGAELSNDEDPIPIIRIMIKRPDQEGESMTKEQLDQLSKGLRFCGNSKEPCSKCPYFGELDPFDCQTKIMHKAAEIIEGLAKEE